MHACFILMPPVLFRGASVGLRFFKRSSMSHSRALLLVFKECAFGATYAMTLEKTCNTRVRHWPCDLR